MTAAATVDAATPAKEPIVLATEDAADEAALAALEAALEAALDAAEEAEEALDAAEEVEEAEEEEEKEDEEFSDLDSCFDSLFFSFLAEVSFFGSLKVSETRKTSPCPLIESSFTKCGFSLSIRMFCRSLLAFCEPSGFVILYVFLSSFTISHPYNIRIISNEMLFETV